MLFKNNYLHLCLAQDYYIVFYVQKDENTELSSLSTLKKIKKNTIKCGEHITHTKNKELNQNIGLKEFILSMFILKTSNHNKKTY